MFFLQAEDGIRDLVRSRGLGDVYKRQGVCREPPGPLEAQHPLDSGRVGQGGVEPSGPVVWLQDERLAVVDPVQAGLRGGRDDGEGRQPGERVVPCLLYTSPSPRDRTRSRMPSSA